VDDHEVVRSLLRHLLEGENGWRVCGEAANGDEAVERSLTLHPDVVVIDAVTPRRNGFDATREIVRNSPEIPVVITTLVSLKGVWRNNRGDQPARKTSVIVKTLANDDGNEIGLT
jgi:DNA-binding NarL/FixJ family response regulator